MRLGAAEKLEVIRLVEDSELSARRTLRELGVPRSTFYAWYKRYAEAGEAGLQVCGPAHRRHWNRIPENVRQQVVETALEHTELSPRELACQMTDREGGYAPPPPSAEGRKTGCLLSPHLRCPVTVTSPAYVVMSASDRFQHPTRRPNELWQTDFTYLRVVGWGCYYLSTVLDDYSRKILAWKLTTRRGSWGGRSRGLSSTTTTVGITSRSGT